MKTPVVAIIGRPNTGKSSLFNRLVKERKAIVEDTPGVTRDRLYGDAYFLDHHFKVIDTGGITEGEDIFNKDIYIQAEIAMDEADLILFVVDGKEGLSLDDRNIDNILRKSEKPVFLVVNKTDHKDFSKHQYDFYELNHDDLFLISAEENKGTYELCEGIIKKLPNIREDDDDRLKIAIMGRPNTGKSSLINAITKENRAIVSSVAGTTRDSVDSVYKYHGEEIVFIDTAGLRKKGKIYENIEKYSYLRSMQAIEKADICLLLISGEDGLIEHDKHIAGYIKDAGKGLIIIVNKWDITPDETKRDIEQLIRLDMPFVSYAPILLVSAETGRNVSKILPKIMEIKENITRDIKTSVLNEVVQEAYILNIPPTYKTKRLKIYFTSQTGIKPPKFAFRVNDKGLVHFSYYRYLENKIREAFNFEGTPIELTFKNKSE